MTEHWFVICENKYYSKSGRFTYNILDAYQFTSYKEAYVTYRKFLKFDGKHYAIIKGLNKFLKAA